MSHFKHFRVIAPLTVFLVVLTVVATIGGGLVRAASLVLVSGPSPYTGCSTLKQSGTNFLNAEVEPYVAVNPATVGTANVNLIGAWQQDRWSNGGARGLVAGFSSNGGATWGETELPFNFCAGAGALNYDRASDPWVSIGPDGTAYAVSISVTLASSTTGRPAGTAVGVATSTTGGATWTNTQTIIADPGTVEFFNDKESVTANPTTAGVAYVVWDRLVQPNGNPVADLHTQAFTGPTMFSKTTNGGVTWSAPRIIVDTRERQQTIANQVVVDPRNGTLYDFFNLIERFNHQFATREFNQVAFIKSTDGGNTWTKPNVIATLGSVGVTDPNTGQLIRTGDIVPEPAIDPATGQLYVVWQDSRFNGGHFDEVALSTSTNGGATWSTPIQVNTNTPSTRPGFTPQVTVNSNGTVGVSYYDFRSLGSETSTLPTDYWFRTLTPTLSLGSETHIAGPFDMKTAPLTTTGFFVGDYEGLTNVGKTFEPFFVQANSGNTANRTDVFTTFI